MSGHPSDVSVIMCTYNGERFVEQQLRSILDQTQPPAEIVVSDDGSTDRTLDIVESIAATADVPVRLCRNSDRLGFADNFLSACDQAACPYIAFSDQDDVWNPRKLELGRRSLRDEGAVLCVHPVELIDCNGAVVGDSHRETGPARVMPPLVADPLGNFYGFTMMFDRSLLERIPRGKRGLDPYTPDVVLSHDRWVYFLATTFGRTVVLADDLAGYRQHDCQLYGGPEERTPAQRIASKLATGQSQAQYLARLAGHRAALLESLEPADEGLARTGAARWRALESHFLDRARLHDDMPPPRRFRALLDAARRGTYRGFRRGGLGPRRLLEDLVVTVLRVRGPG